MTKKLKKKSTSGDLQLSDIPKGAFLGYVEESDGFLHMVAPLNSGSTRCGASMAEVEMASAMKTATCPECLAQFRSLQKYR